MSVIPKKNTLAGRECAKYTLKVETHEPYYNRKHDKMSNTFWFRSDDNYRHYQQKGVVFKDSISVELQALIYHLYKKQHEYRLAEIFMNFVPDGVENFHPNIYSREIIPGGEIKCTIAPYASDNFQFVLRKYKLI